jgi:hypothetical protein
MDGAETELGFVRFGAVNCEADKNLCSKLEVKSFPTVRLYARDEKGQEHMEPYPSGKSRTAENLIEHAEMSIRLAAESSLSPIDGFIMAKNVTNSDSTGLWIVMFESARQLCAQCGPVKASLRRMSANLGKLVNFGIFDCDKDPKVCKQQYVGNKFPMVKIYPYKGSKGTGETLIQPDSNPLDVLPIAEKVIRMCIAEIEAENALMKTPHEEYEEEPQPLPPPQPEWRYPEPERHVFRSLPPGTRANTNHFLAGR